jgi:streptogramin lyase
VRSSWALLLSFSPLLLAGCSGAPVATTSQTSNASAGAAIKGRVHGGQNPIVGASVYLYAASTSGYGTASTSLLTSATGNPADGNGNYYVTTDSNGNFTITGDYTCPSTASQVYLYAVGGNPGAGVNSGAVLMAALGTCPASGTLSSSLYVVVNEVSTIATAFALTGYQRAGEPTEVGSPNRTLALAGIANAFATVANLETLSTGAALATTPAGNGTVEQTTINTLANILAACINSAGPSSADCTTLFSNSEAGGVPTTNTAQAAIFIARNPNANISLFFGLQGANAPFQPSLSAAPNDFTIAINYTGGGLNYPYAAAIDSSGNIWIANEDGNSISKFGPLGAAISPSTGYTGGGLSGPADIAIDGSGNVWVTNYSGGTGASISEFNSSGTAISTSSGFTGGGLDGAYLLAIDKSGNLWVTNNKGSSLSEFNSSGGAISGTSGFTGGGLNNPIGIAVDTSGDVWVANNGNNSISEFDSSNGSAISGSSGDTGGGLDSPGDLHVDFSGNLWINNPLGNDVSEFSSSGTAVSGSSGYTGGGLNSPYGIALDSAGYVYTANNSGNSFSKYASNSSNFISETGFQGGGLSAPIDIAIDGSNNVWVTNSGNNSLTEFVGQGVTPAVTPIVANLLTPYGAHAVNEP